MCPIVFTMHNCKACRKMTTHGSGESVQCTDALYRRVALNILFITRRSKGLGRAKSCLALSMNGCKAKDITFLTGKQGLSQVSL